MFGALTRDSFAHGIHPPQMKEDTSHLSIRRFPFAPLLIVPFAQHLGTPAVPIVRAGQEVVRGQMIPEPDGFVSVAMHAPTTGVVRKIALAPSIGGNMIESVFIEPLPASTQWDIVSTAADKLLPIYDELIRRAAEGRVLYSDDTSMRVLSLRKAIDELVQKGETKRTGIFSTGILADLVDGQRVALYFTGREHAGENIATLLAQRKCRQGPTPTDV